MVCIYDLTLSGSLETVNLPPSSDPSVVIDISSHNVEPELQQVAINSSYATNVEVIRKNSIPQVVKEFLRRKDDLLVSVAFCLCLVIFIIIAGFSHTESSLEEVSQSSTRMAMNESFFNALKINSKNDLFSRNLDQAKPYCKPPTSLPDCELNWSKLRNEMDPAVRHMDLGFVNSSHECYITPSMYTCFGPLNGTHIEVVIMPSTNWHHSAEIKINAYHILAVDPYSYLLVTGARPEQFCWLNLYGHGSCLTQ